LGKGICADFVCVCVDRTQMYVEAEARMDTYKGEDQVTRTSLNLLQRMLMTFAALSGFVCTD
jgi:hypothetical protein